MRFIKSYDGYRLIRESEFKIESFLKGVQKNYKLSDEQFNQFVANYSDKLKEIVSKNTDRNILKYKSKYEDYLKHLDNVYNKLKNTNVKSDLDVPELFKMKYGKELIKDDVDKYNELINSSDNKDRVKSILKSLISDEDKFISKLHELYTELYNKRNPGTKINPNLEGLKPVAEYDNGNIKVFRVNSLIDSRLLGRNTSFCITGSTMYGYYVYGQKNNIWYIYDFNPKNKDNEINVVMLNGNGKFNFTNIINQTKDNLTYDQVLSNNDRLKLVDKSVFSYKEINDYYYRNPSKVTPSNDPEDQISALIGSLNGNRNMPNVNLENKQNLDFLINGIQDGFEVIHNVLDKYKNVDYEKVYGRLNSKQKRDYFSSGGYKGIPSDEYLDAIKNNNKLNNNNIKNVIKACLYKLGDDADLNFLDVSNVTSMRSLFRGDENRGPFGNFLGYEISYFNGDISKWDVSNVTDMYEMFNNCVNFNGDLSKWNVSNVTNMMGMFKDCKEFNVDISKWNVSNVARISNMFFGCEKFNGDLSNWNVGNITDPRGFYGMFNGCVNFNGDLSKWDVSNITNMAYMFGGCTNFNGDISKWDVSKVTEMTYMFGGCTNFNGDISKWNVSNVKYMNDMFNGCRNFTYDLSNWVKVNPKFKYIIPKVGKS